MGWICAPTNLAWASSPPPVRVRPAVVAALVGALFLAAAGAAVGLVSGAGVTRAGTVGTAAFVALQVLFALFRFEQGAGPIPQVGFTGSGFTDLGCRLK